MAWFVLAAVRYNTCAVQVGGLSSQLANQSTVFEHPSCACSCFLLSQPFRHVQGAKVRFLRCKIASDWQASARVLLCMLSSRRVLDSEWMIRSGLMTTLVWALSPRNLEQHTSSPQHCRSFDCPNLLATHLRDASPSNSLWVRQERARHAILPLPVKSI